MPTPPAYPEDEQVTPDVTLPGTDAPPVNREDANTGGYAGAGGSAGSGSGGAPSGNVGSNNPEPPTTADPVVGDEFISPPVTVTPVPAASDGPATPAAEMPYPTGGEDIPEYTPGTVTPPAGGPVNVQGSVPNVAGPVAIPESTTGIKAEMTPWEVTEEQTVAGQLDKLYNRDSAFFQLARERATRAHLASGGQNSAMAAGAAEMAAMDTAFKVGFADAQTYARSAEFNANMSNQFGLAEQRFVHNALLSDQNYQQAIQLEKQRIAGQLESIRMDYAGRGQLLDREIESKFALMAQEHEYALDKLWEGEEAFEGREQRGFGRSMTLNGMLQMTNFYTNYVASAMQYANNPNFTPAQQSAAMREAMDFGAQQFDYVQSFWGAWAMGGPPADPDWLGQSSTSPVSNWWQYSGGPTPSGQSGP